MLYPYKVFCGNTELIMLWEDCKSGGDRFVVSRYPGRIIAFSSMEDVKQYAIDKQLDVSWDETGTLDLNWFDNTLASLRPGRKCSVDTCEILLEGWNFLEDFFRTLSLDITALKSDELRRPYEKIFYGNNLSSITPMVKSTSRYLTWMK